MDLQGLLPPGGSATFWDQVFDRESLHVQRDDPSFYGDELTLLAFERQITAGTFPMADLALVRDGEEQRPKDLGSALRGLAHGWSLVARSVQRGWPEVARLCRGLSSDFRCRVNVNAYLTPPGGRAFVPHYDTHDVLVLQLAGAKRWSLWKGPVVRPVAEQPDPGGSDARPAARDWLLRPGDLAYIPRGMIHVAEGADAGPGMGIGSSLHLSYGLHTATWADLLSRLTKRAALGREELRAAVPPSLLDPATDPSLLVSAAAQHLGCLADRGTVTALLSDHDMEVIRGRAADTTGQVGAIAALDGLDAATPLRLRYREVQLRRDRHEVQLHYPGRTLALPLECADSLEQLLLEGGGTAGGLPAELCISLRLELCRRLVVEGLLTI